MSSRLLLALCLLALVPVRAFAGEARIRIAVLDVHGSGNLGDEVPATLTALEAAQLARTGVFQVLTGEDLRQMLSVERAKMALGCEEASCIAEIGGALGAPYVLTGTLGRLGPTLVLSLSLIEIATARVAGREMLSVDDVGKLAHELEPVLGRVVAPVLYKESGTLKVDCAEEGALVHVDGVLVGTVPFAPRQVPAGPRTVSVTKEGFVESRQDVLIPPKGEASFTARLLPSQEFVDAYRQRAGRTRLAAWATAGGALLAAAGGAGLFLWNDATETRLRSEAGVAPGEPLPVTQEESNQLLARDVGGFVLLGTSVILAGVSGYLFVTGDPPDRYDAR